jgi:hypothetical protein
MPKHGLENLSDHFARDRFMAGERKLPSQDLEQSGTSKPDGSLSRRLRFKRPAGLAFSGGLAAAVLAVALGTNIVQATLVRAAQSTATDSRKPVMPPAAIAASKAPQATSSSPAGGTTAPTVSARALFNESKQEGKTAGSATQLKPLGLRYSFVIRGSDGQEREVDARTAAKSPEQVRINVEASQDAYLQILQTLGAAGTRLWWPQQETGKISLKVLAGKRNEIPLPPPAESGLLSLIIRLSPKPFGPLTVQEVGMLDRFSADLLIESVSPGGSTGAQEQATYAVSQAATPAAQIAVEIPFDR